MINMVESVKKLIEYYKDVKREVYLDLENSSPVPKEVLDEMIIYFNSKAYGNPTITHKPGWEAYETIMEIRDKISKYINTDSAENIHFTPGETEANNLAILGTTLFSNKKGKIIISEIESLSILNLINILSNFGYEVVKIPVDKNGFINLDSLDKSIDKNTTLVSIMMVNNEIGSIEPIKEAIDIIRDKNSDVIIHSDASDAYGRIPIDLKKLDLDLMTISSYKILGPRGIGALYVKDGLEINRIIEGQIGTDHLWPGIENTPLIVGFGKASEIIFSDFENKVNHMKRLRDMLIDGILNNIESTILNGPNGDQRSPDNVNISFIGCEGESLTIELSLYGVYVSSGSACTRRMLVPSHVLTAIGRKHLEAHGSILMKVSWIHKIDDIKYVLSVIPSAVNRIRGITPKEVKNDV